MKILVGLGNPGDKYEMNRHNVGFMAVDAIAEKNGANPWKRRFQGLACEAEIGREKCLLLKPTTFMNESGRSIGEAMRFFKISPADVIVLHDELDLEPGRVRVKFGGGHAGHNGLKSISAHIGNDYHRVRIGIGHPGSREAVVGYVLHDFSKKDREWLEPLLGAISAGAAHLLSGQEAKFLNEIARIAKPAAAPGRPLLPLTPAGPEIVKPLKLKELEPAEGEAEPMRLELDGAPTRAGGAAKTAPEATTAVSKPVGAKSTQAKSTVVKPEAVGDKPGADPAHAKPGSAAPSIATSAPAASAKAAPSVPGKAEQGNADGLAAKLKAWFSRK